MHSDACNAFLAVAVKQCDESELLKSVNEQKHVQLAFLSGPFGGAQEHLSIYEEESIAVMQTFQQLNYLLGCAKNVTVFTGHSNMLFAIHPAAVEPSLGRHEVMKFILWALYHSAFKYTIEHVPGNLHTMADIVTRWMRGYRSTLPTAQIVARSTMGAGNSFVPRIPDNPAEWPSHEHICNLQRSSKR